MLCFVLINSVILNLLCVCTLTKSLHSLGWEDYACDRCCCFVLTTTPHGQPFAVFGGFLSISGGWRLYARSLSRLKIVKQSLAMHIFTVKPTLITKAGSDLVNQPHLLHPFHNSDAGNYGSWQNRPHKQPTLCLRDKITKSYQSPPPPLHPRPPARTPITHTHTHTHTHTPAQHTAQFTLP